MATIVSTLGPAVAGDGRHGSTSQLQRAPAGQGEWLVGTATDRRCQAAAMVKVGVRAAALLELLVATGRTPARGAPPAPRLHSLDAESADAVLGLYRALGGTLEAPALRPGPWDLVFADGLVVELDEELHFNRYRSVTLGAPWAPTNPWTVDYLQRCHEQETACLAAATWGKRWTNPSCERLFGIADPPGVLGAAGAPRWKQRALYDAMKDAAAAVGAVRLARLATHDDLGGVTLGAALERRAPADLDRLIELLNRRATPP